VTGASAKIIKLRRRGEKPVDSPIEEIRDPDGNVIARRCRMCGVAGAGEKGRLRHQERCRGRRPKRAHGEGSKARRKSDGTWEATLTLPDGSRKYFVAATQAQAVTKRERARTALARGLPLPDERLTTGVWLRDWFEKMHVPEIKPSTRRYQRSILTRHLLPALGDIPLIRLRALDVSHYLDSKQKEGLTPAVVGTHRGMLVKALDAAIVDDKLARNVALAVRSPRQRRRRQFECSPEQVLTFLSLIRGHPLEVVFLFGMTLGLRIGEATGVLWSDIDLDHGLVYLRHQVAPDVQYDGGICICGSRCGRAAIVGDLKTEASNRGLELPEVLGPALRRQALRVERTRQLRQEKGKEWLEHDLVTPSARGGPMQPQRARGWIVTLAGQAGLPDGCRFHDLRHMWVSLLRAAGVSDEDVAKAAGHASPQVTMSMYAHAMAGSAHRVADTVNQLLPMHPDDSADETSLRSTLLALRVRRESSGRHRD
jgi:integrase